LICGKLDLHSNLISSEPDSADMIQKI